MVVGIEAGETSTVTITYSTGTSTVYSYGTLIWVDWNKNYTFEDSEIVYTGTSAQGSGGTPQVLTATFTVPDSQAADDYRMRIAGADSYFDNYIGGSASANHDPCFTSTWAVCHDYTLRVIATTYTQTVTLSEDWNWWSSNLDITLGELKEALGTHGPRIAAQDGKFATYNANSGTWSGNLQSIELGKMYKIRTTETCTITFSGEVLDPAEHPITLFSGNNWIGFIGTQSMSLDQAFGNFTPTDRDVIKAANGKATYYQGYGWQGSLNTLEPSHRYIYKSNATETRTFTYPSAK